MQERLEERALEQTLDLSSRVPQDFAIRKALQMLYDSGIKGMPPLRTFSQKPMNGVVTQAFVKFPQPDTMFVNDATKHYKSAMEGNEEGLRAIAAAMAHEQYHMKNGQPEQGAYETQMKVLSALGGGKKEQAQVQKALELALTQ